MLAVVRKRTNLLRLTNCLLKQYGIATACRGQAVSRLNYHEYVKSREEEAKRSVIVEVESEQVYADLHAHLSANATIVKAHHYSSIDVDLQTQHILLEFSSPEAANRVIDSARYDPNERLKVRSPFLRYSGKDNSVIQHTVPELNNINGTHKPTAVELHNTLSKASNIDEQITLLHERTKVNDLGIRLRFFAAHQLQLMLRGLVPFESIVPLGSSINGFGNVDSKLDLLMYTTPDSHRASTSSGELAPAPGKKNNQYVMYCVRDILDIWLPGVEPIPSTQTQAIFFRHDILDLGVDLNHASSKIKHRTSELFYTFAQLDSRVPLLASSIRYWAHSQGLTKRGACKSISNFALDCLLVHFLQRLETPVLPPAYALISSDNHSSDNLRDFQSVEFASRSRSQTLSTVELLGQFFEFYSNFNFEQNVISLNPGREALRATGEHTIYIEHPLDPTSIVSQVVSPLGNALLKDEMYKAVCILTEQCNSNHQNKADWGLLKVFQKSSGLSRGKPVAVNTPRLVELNNLFSGAAQKSNDKVEYKSDDVKRQVEAIKAKANVDLMAIKARVKGS